MLRRALLLVSLLVSLESVSAAIFPATGPSGSFSGGMFGTYINNMSSNPCPTGQVIYGYNTGTASYGTPLCRVVSAAASSDYWKSIDSGANIYFTGTTNVGIGTNTPGSKLHILNQLPGAQSDKSLLYISDLWNAGSNGQFFQILGGTSGINLISNWNSLSFGARGDGGTVFKRDMTITTAGNVGIGTSTPSSILHASGGWITASRGGKTLYLNPNYAAGNAYAQVAPLGTDNMGLSLSSKDTNPEYMFISNNGNVGIGIPTPGTKLDVVGEIRGVNGKFTDGTSQSTLTGTLNLNASGGSVLFDDGGQKRISWNDGAGNLNIRAGNYMDGVGLKFAKGIADTNGGAATITMSTDGVDGSISLNTAPIGVPGAVVTYSNTFNMSPTSSYFTNNLGIGTTVPRTKLEVVNGAVNVNGDTAGVAADFTSLTPTGQNSTVSIESNDVVAADKGGVLGFGGRWTGNTYANWASIKGLKVDGTANYGGYLSFFTRPNGASSAERMRIDSVGNVGIGTPTPTAKLSVTNGDDARIKIFSNGSSVGVIDAVANTNDALGRWLSINPTGGNVGIGTNSPSFKLDVNGNGIFRDGLRAHNAAGAYTYITLGDDESPNGVKYIHANSNVLGFLNGGGGWMVYWDNSGNMYNYGNITSVGGFFYSDRRLKDNITPLSNSLDKILSLNGYSFDWKKDGRKDIGVIAQEVEKAFPDIVHSDEKTGMKSVEYANLVAPIIESIKELHKNSQDNSAVVNRKIDLIKEENSKLKEENISLKTRLEKIEKKLDIQK